MVKRFLFSLSLILCLQNVWAQTMTEGQIIKFVQSEQEKGSTQNDIAKKLLQRGVTPAQLRDIKKKYDAEKKLLGASDLTGADNGKNRMRSGKNDKRRLTVGHLVEDGDNEHSGKLDIIDRELDFLDIDSVMYYRNMLEESRVFGRNIFNNKLLTFEPSDNMPTPSDYVLGAGDQVLIDVWGASQNMIDATISPDGKIVVEGVGPLYLAGKTVEAAGKYVSNALSGLYAESSISLTVGTVRSIQVQVMGEVVTPGSYTLSALSTAFNALYAAGGISDLGTLRSINVFRNGKSIATVDIYDFIFNGRIDGNVRLQDNDVISVGAYEAIVNIQGKVKRPMMYEMKGDETLSKLVQYSGGFASDAYSEKLRIVRKNGREYSLFTVDRKDMAAFAMCDGDSVYIDSVIPRFSNMVEVSGAVFFPGQYQLSEDINSVSELIEAAGGIREDAFLNRVVLHHRNADNTIEANAVDVKGIMSETVDDVALRNNDVLFIPSISEMKGEETVTIGGEVNFPGKYKFAENTTVEDIVLQAGGLTRAASTARIDVFRQMYDPSAVEMRDSIAQSFSFEIKDGFVVDGTNGFVLKPYDQIYVRRSPLFKDFRNVGIKGAVNFDGTYSVSTREYRLSDLVNAAGGIAKDGYTKGASLLRRMTEDEILQNNVLRKSTQIEFYEDLLNSSASMDQSVLDSLYVLKNKIENTYHVSIDLEKAMEEPGSEHDIMLRDGDVLTIPEYNSTVFVYGEVSSPSSINWKKNKPVKYYIKHAGGFSNRAKKNGIYVINMNGSIEKVSKFSRKAVMPGCKIIIPRKQERKKVSAAEIVTIGTSTASLATMLVTLINLLK